MVIFPAAVSDGDYQDFRAETNTAALNYWCIILGNRHMRHASSLISIPMNPIRCPVGDLVKIWGVPRDSAVILVSVFDPCNPWAAGP